MFEDSIQTNVGLSNILSKVKAIVTFFKKSARASDILREKTQLKLIQSVPTRWNSTFFMLQRFIKLSTFLNEALFALSVIDVTAPIPTMVNSSELAILKEVLELLEPWADVTTELGAEKNVTGSKIIPITYCLRKAISKMEPKTTIACLLKRSLQNSLHNRLHFVEENRMLSVSTFLDPRFKTDNFENPLNISKTISVIDLEHSS